MPIFEFRDMLVEVLFVYPASEDPVTLECTDLRSEMLFTITRLSGEGLVLSPISKQIPLDLIAKVAAMAEEGLPLEHKP